MESRIYIQGSTGKMGKAILEELKKYPQFIVTSNFQDATVALDVSVPAALTKILELCLEAKKPLIVGTTGHSEEQKNRIKEAAQVIPILHSPNFAQGMSWLHAITGVICKELSKDARVEITETHHTEKRDAPSGSALALKAATGREDVPIVSKRIGESPGVHTVKLSWRDEELELTHRTLNRRALAEGAVYAILFIQTKPPGYYTLCHL